MEAKAQGNAPDRGAVQEIVTTFDQAWTASDPARFAAQYASVADWVGPNGAVLTDPAAITDPYTALFTVVFPNTTRQSTIRNPTFLTGTIAVLDIDTLGDRVRIAAARDCPLAAGDPTCAGEKPPDQAGWRVAHGAATADARRSRGLAGDCGSQRHF